MLKFKTYGEDPVQINQYPAVFTFLLLYIFSSILKPVMGTHFCNLSTWEAEDHCCRFQVSLGYKVTPCIKIPLIS